MLKRSGRICWYAFCNLVHRWSIFLFNKVNQEQIDMQNKSRIPKKMNSQNIRIVFFLTFVHVKCRIKHLTMISARETYFYLCSQSQGFLQYQTIQINIIEAATGSMKNSFLLRIGSWLVNHTILSCHIYVILKKHLR